MSWLSCEMILKNSVCGGPSLLDVNNVESWEKIFANKATNRRLISKIYKRFMKLDINKTGLPWWLHGQRIHLPMQKTQVRSLVWEHSTCCRATKPMGHNYWARAPQQEKPPQWEAGTPQLESSPCSPQLEKTLKQQQRPSGAKNKQS